MGRFHESRKPKKMHDQQRSDRRSRTGSRQRRNRRGREDSRPSGYIRPELPVKKLSFWQKLASLFTGKPKPVKSRRSQPAPAARQERQQPAENGHRRFETAAPRQTRKPEWVEVSSPKLYVGNLSFDATETDLEELFNGVGQVQSAEVVSNKYTQKSKGFAFVTLLTIDEARRAVTELHDKDFMGRKLVVSGAKTGERDAGPERRSEAPDAREERAPVAP